MFPFLSKAIQDGSGSSWEIDFCKAVRVRWQKVVNAKKYMYCHENVLHWDDSAGEEAFQNAKRIYWEKINGLPSETPLPDPDVYIDKIDWSPDIDPGLIADLDREYFNADETESIDKLDFRTAKVHNPDPGCDLDNGTNNPWEKGTSHKVDSLKGPSATWGQYDKSISTTNVSNPWEQSSFPLVESLMNTPWTRHVDESSCWNQELKRHRQCPMSISTCENSWNRGCQDGGYFGEKGWRQDDWTRGWKRWNINGHDQQISGDNFNAWQNDFVSHTRVPWKKVWDDKHLKSSFKGSTGIERAHQSGCRKREGSFQNRPRFKTSRFQGDDYGAAYQWQKEKSHDSVRFYV